MPLKVISESVGCQLCNKNQLHDTIINSSSTFFPIVSISTHNFGHRFTFFFSKPIIVGDNWFKDVHQNFKFSELNKVLKFLANSRKASKENFN